MKIVTDSGFDLSPEQQQGVDLHTLPLKINLGGTSYLSGIDINKEEFYQLLENTEEMPTTSTPSPGEFLEIYQKVMEEDLDILSLHISSGLSGTYNSAMTAAGQIPEANITLVDTRSLSIEMGWQVEAAIRAVQAGWPTTKILELLSKIRAASEIVFTLPDLSYLIHGGRISHLQGLLASLLGIKPLIGVDKTDGKYHDRGKARTFKGAIQAIPKFIAGKFEAGAHLRTQIGHAENPEGADQLRQEMEKLFSCEWLPDCSISPVLGAHTGRGLVGVVFASLKGFPEMP
jgi:DegV family protein with EDD domain